MHHCSRCGLVLSTGDWQCRGCGLVFPAPVPPPVPMAKVPLVPAVRHTQKRRLPTPILAILAVAAFVIFGIVTLIFAPPDKHQPNPDANVTPAQAMSIPVGTQPETMMDQLRPANDTVAFGNWDGNTAMEFGEHYIVIDLTDGGHANFGYDDGQGSPIVSALVYDAYGNTVRSEHR